MRQQRHYKSAIGVAVAGVALLMTTMGDMRLHAATILQREPAIGELRLGQRVLVDDGRDQGSGCGERAESKDVEPPAAASVREAELSEPGEKGQGSRRKRTSRKNTAMRAAAYAAAGSIKSLPIAKITRLRWCGRHSPSDVD
jgi:hypothetical protein